MSISSCERFRSNDVWVDISSRKTAIDIGLEAIPLTITGLSAGSLGTSTGGSITVNGGTPVFVPGMNVYTSNASTLGSMDSSYQTLGYRLFFKDGYLKCVKKERPHYHTYAMSMTSTTIYPDRKSRNRHDRESFYHPAAIWESVTDPKVRLQIQNHICALALRMGVQVPSDFMDSGNQYNGVARGYYFAALDWLAYPLVREINSPAFTKNLLNKERNIVAPNFEPMNFRQLVQHYYGNATGKMIEELWKVVTEGGDFKRTHFAAQEARHAFFEHGQCKDILRDEGEYVTQIGDRHLRAHIFTLGPAILKTMGFDYFYQALAKFGNVKFRMRDFEYGVSQHRPRQIEWNLETLLKSVTPKKLISALFDGTDIIKQLDHLHDTASMLRDFEDPNKIPKTLKFQYPTGLVVDFKFKTLKELHDKISTQYTIIKAESNKREIPVSPQYGLLNGRELNGLKLVVPDNTATLAIWGKLLNICVASYGDNAVRGGTLLLGVEKEGNPKYCIELRSHVVERHMYKAGLIANWQEGQLPEQMIAPEVVREFFPKLEKKHMGVTPMDTPEEEEYYSIPSIVQFRSERNGDPDPIDRRTVENMLIQWTKENFEFLGGLDGIFEVNSNFWGEGEVYQYNVHGAVLDEGVLQNAVQAAVDQGGRADDMIIHIPPVQFREMLNLYRRNNEGNYVIQDVVV